MTNDDINQSQYINKYLRFEDSLDGEEEVLPSFLGGEIIEACKIIYEFSSRIPHVYPFPEGAVKNHIGLRNYQYSLITCVSEMMSPILLDSDISGSAFHLNVSLEITSILDVIKHWILNAVYADDHLFQLLNNFDLNTYRLMTLDQRCEVHQELNHLSQQIRQRLMAEGHREKVHSFKRNATENYKQVLKMAESKWQRFGKVLLIRLDWGYKKPFPDRRGVFLSSQDFEQRFKIVCAYRDKKLKALRKKYRKDLAFYVWKIECAPIKGLHIHWLIGLNGTKHQDRINVPKAIAQMWDAAVGNPDTYTWNLNAQQKNEDAILRVIDYSDPSLWPIVGGYAEYLTKVDYVVHLRAPERMHGFGSSKVPKVVKRKTGPKRSKPEQVVDPWAVRRPLRELNVAKASKGNQ